MECPVPFVLPGRGSYQSISHVPGNYGMLTQCCAGEGLLTMGSRGTGTAYEKELRSVFFFF